MQHAVVGRLLGDLVMQDQPGSGIDRRLDVVGRRPGTPSDAHQACVLLAFDQRRPAFVFQPVREPAKFGAPIPQGRDRRLNRAGRIVGLAGVGVIETGEIIGDLPVKPGGLIGNPTSRNDLPRARRSPELRAVQRHQPRREQPRIPAQKDEGPARPHDRRSVVAAKIGDRLEVGDKPAQQPHRLDIAPALPLQSPRRANLVEIAPHIQLQQIARVVARPARRCRNRPAKAESRHVQPVHKCVDHPDRGVLR